MEMGFPEDVCAEALERYDGDENLALNFFLGGWINSVAFISAITASFLVLVLLLKYVAKLRI